MPLENRPVIFQWLLPVAGLLLLAGIAIVLIAHAVRRIRYGRAITRSAAADPLCGQCGYIIIPGSSVRCPECGGYLPSVGVLTCATVPPAPPGGWMLMMIALLAPLAGLVAPFVAEWQPWGWECHAWKIRDVIAYGNPTPGARALIMVEASGTGRWGSKTNQLIILTSYPGTANGQWLAGASLVATGGKVSTTSSGGAARTVDEAELLKFLQRAGLDPRAGATQELARELVTDVLDFAQYRFPPEMTAETPLDLPGSGVRYLVPDGTRAIVALVLWLILCIPACGLMRRRHARRLARVRAATEDLLRRLRLRTPYTAASAGTPDVSAATAAGAAGAAAAAAAASAAAAPAGGGVA